MNWIHWLIVLAVVIAIFLTRKHWDGGDDYR
jgi:Sec-independent protein translocase protein TatA